MSVEPISKFQPHRTMYLRGFDRRGCSASMHNASASGFTVSGLFSDLADFVVLGLQNVDDDYGHLTTTRYLPDFTLTGVVVEFDLAVVNGMYPGSKKFPSVPWDKLSWIKSDGTAGTTALNITSTSGQVAASQTYTVNGTPVAFDRVQLIYLGNVVFDYVVVGGDTTTTVATAMAAQINAATSSIIPLTATSAGPSFTVTCTQPGQDGNTIELLELHKTATTFLTPAGTSKLTGGVDPTLFHVKLDFSLMSLTSLRECWMTLAPSLPIDGGGTNPALVAFTAKEFSYTFSNWTVTDPNSHTPLKVAGPGSVVVGSSDWWATYTGSGWVSQDGAYYYGFSRISANSGDAVTVQYSCQSTHNLYVGTVLGAGLGTFHITLDGIAQADLVCTVGGGPGRRLIASGVAAGSHTVVLTLASSLNCTFDFLQAAVLSDVHDPAVTYPHGNAACDFDTGQTYQIAPARALRYLQRLGFTGDLDFYAGVFFALKRVRSGGNFHQATVSLGGVFGTGTGFGDGDAVFVDIGGTTLGAAVYPADTNTTVAQRLVDGINGLFVAVCAAPTGTAGQFTITTLSPINGFTLSVTLSVGATGTVSTTGDINAGNEGTWGVDAAQASPLNRAFVDYLTDLAGLLHTAGQTMTVAFSQELLAPPDVNTSGGAWSQRYADGKTVLTATGFGSWGAGFIDGLAAGVYQQIGHGYVTGNTGHFASGSGSGVWSLVVTNADHYTLGAQIFNSGGYTPGAGDSVFIELQTTQCAFNPSTVTPYLQKCYVQTANILAAASLTPWLQFGEILHWFFSEVMSLGIAGFSNSSGLIKVQTAAAHGFATGQRAILAGTGISDGTKTITVIDATHFTVNGSTWPGGSPAAAGTVSGGGMAYYDANQTAAATAALGRALASFYTQDDDPTVNSGTDANFLAGRIFAHISTIVAAVLVAQPGAKIELLYPLDVNLEPCYYTAALPFPQGGRMNATVNLPGQFHVKSGSGLDRIKMEGLSWQSFYFHFDNAVATFRYPYTLLGWSKADTAILIAWDNGACNWPMMYRFFLNEGIPLVNLWAVDHSQLFSWGAVLPVNQPRVV
jgi:hypothetical protein